MVKVPELRPQRGGCEGEARSLRTMKGVGADSDKDHAARFVQSRRVADVVRNLIELMRDWTIAESGPAGLFEQLLT